MSLIDDIVNNFNYTKIITEQLFTITKISTISSQTNLTGQTLNNHLTDDEINYYDLIKWSSAIKYKESVKSVFENTIKNSFDYFLKKLNISEEILVKNIRENVKIREKLQEIIFLLKRKTKKFEIVGQTIFNFPKNIQRHKTNIEKIIDSDSIMFDRILYLDSDNTVYFDSEPELKFFEEIINRKPLKFIFQNPRTNQGGVSFYIPENDTNHSPDFIINYNNKNWFIEVTSWNRISEKEKYIKSQGLPNNYMLVALNSKNKLVTLTKEQYNEKTFNNENNWTKINECYVNI